VDRFGFVDADPGRMRVETLPLGTVTVALVRSTGHDIALHEPDRSSFLIPLAGRIAVSTRGDTLETAAGGALFVSPGHRTTQVRAPVDRAYEAVVALAPRSRPEKDSRGGAARPARDRVFASHAQDAAAAAVSGYCRYLVEEWARPGTPLDRPGARRASEALLLDLFAALDADDAEVPARAAPTRRVRLAEEIMRARSDEPLTVAGLARETGVGVRSLQLAFREHRGTSPRAALNALRLDRAREQLVAPDAATSVTEVALANGFTHFGRFAAAYRLRFGEPPSETLRRARR
jgi:AraC-like DNA-binding protein